MKIQLPDEKPIFDFVMLSHAHADHAQGLKKIMREFGTKIFLYPKSLQWRSFSDLIRYASRSSNVVHHQSVDNTKLFPDFGDVKIDILWPDRNCTMNNENNNSVVLTLTHGNNCVVLTGDAEEEVWHKIADKIPNNTKCFKVPHHGSVNGTFDRSGNTPWVDHCPANAHLTMSSHIRPHTHPDQEVIDLFNSKNFSHFRTDEHHHLQMISDGDTAEMKYSHI